MINKKQRYVFYRHLIGVLKDIFSLVLLVLKIIQKLLDLL